MQEQNPSFQTLFPLRPTAIHCVILLMTNIDCKIVVFFSIIKIVFFAQSMQAISLTSLPSLAFYSFTMFTNLKINLLMLFAPVTLSSSVSAQRSKSWNKLVRILLFTPTYNVKLLRLPQALNIALCMCPKIRHYDITV